MNAICHKCGAEKSAPSNSCGSCGHIPQTDEDVAASIMLSSQFLTEEKLQQASKYISTGRKLPFPPGIYNAVLLAVKGAKREVETKNKNTKSTVIWVTALGVACIFLFLIFHPWLHYNLASRSDDIASYESFLRRFPAGEYAASAKERIRILSHDDVWKIALESNSAIKIRGYITTYPDGKNLEEARKLISNIANDNWASENKPYAREQVLKFRSNWPEADPLIVETAVWNDAKAQKELQRVRTYQSLFPDGKFTKLANGLSAEIENEEWIAASKSKSLEMISLFFEQFPNSSYRSESDTVVSNWHNDPKWVESKNTVAAYERFIAQNPNSSYRKYFEKKVIDLEVAEIAAGEHGKLPKSEPLTGWRKTKSESTEIQIKNNTEYEITIRYSGNESRKIVIPSRESETIVLPSGNYKVTASAKATRVTNYYGEEELTGGKYSSEFYIQSSSYPSFNRFR